MLTGVHVLLGYTCLFSCEHCFLHCEPGAGGVFTLSKLKTLHPQALVIEGNIVPLHKLGADFLPLFTLEGRNMLQKRW